MEIAQPLLAPDSTLGTFPTELASCSPSVPRLCSLPETLLSHSCRTWYLSLLNSARFLQAHLSSTATGPPVCCPRKPGSALCHLPEATARDEEQGSARPEPCRLHVSSTGHQVQYDPLTTTLQGQLSSWFFPPPSRPPFQIPTAKLGHEDAAGKSVKSFADEYNQELYIITN